MVRRAGVLLFMSALLVAASDPIAPSVLRPAEAIAAADADPTLVRPGTYELLVVSAARPRGITFLNSEADYRNPKNLSFSLAPAVAAALSKQLDAPARQALLNKVITVAGSLRRERVYNVERGQLRSFSRWAYIVRVEQLDQILAIDGMPLR